MVHDVRETLNTEQLTRYTREYPTAQNAVDIFKGEWASLIPPKFRVETGPIGLFADPRVKWALEVLDGVENDSILELGPLEAGHTYMLSRAGAKHITAIESNVRAFLKCLIVKEITKLQSVEFLFGDFTEYLKASPPKYDVVFANGVLYHMMEPLEFICRIADITDKVVMTTHYYDEELIRANPAASVHFNGAVEKRKHKGYACPHHLQTYQPDSLAKLGFCGGSNPNSYWLPRADIIGALKHFGYRRVEVGCEDPGAANGPTFTVVGIRG